MGTRTQTHNPVLEPLFRAVRANHPKADLALLERAYAMAEELHATQMRKSGDPYITHPLAVTTILAGIGMTEPVLVAALLHDTVEDTPYTLEQLTEDFGEEVGRLVDGVTKLDKVVYGDSVAADTLLTVLEADTPRTMRVDALYAEIEGMRTEGPARELCIRTHAGVQPVLAAVRHETTKRMFRVTLANGASVDVTEDHSLISDAGDAVCPTDLVVGTTRIMVASA